MIVERQAFDHPPGSIHYRPSEIQKTTASNVPAHNKTSERDFAILDMLIRMKSSANIETIEAITMWYRNMTEKLLHQKSDPQKEKMM